VFDQNCSKAEATSGDVYNFKKFCLVHSSGIGNFVSGSIGTLYESNGRQLPNKLKSTPTGDHGHTWSNESHSGK